MLSVQELIWNLYLDLYKQVKNKIKNDESLHPQ